MRGRGSSISGDLDVRQCGGHRKRGMAETKWCREKKAEIRSCSRASRGWPKVYT